jgi:hypothetical protein
MLLVALLLFAHQSSVADLDRLVKAKDVAGLNRAVELPQDVSSPFAVLKTGGAYDVGRFGWSVIGLAGPAHKEAYAVVATKLTSEDVGEILLRETSAGSWRYVPETDDLGMRIERHHLRVRFLIGRKRAEIEDRLDLRSVAGSGPFVFRMSSAYQVSSITDGGRDVPFSQTSGIVLAARPDGRATYDIKYSATVDLPNYAGSIGPDEATLANDYWYPMIARQPAAYDLDVSAPKGWSIVGQGELVEQSESGDESHASYRMDLPVVFFSLSAGPYRSFSQKIGNRTYYAWSLRLSESRLKLQTELSAPINEFYSRAFGAYPFTRWGVLDSPHYGGGALEAYSYATYGGGVPDEDAHEPAHTWWGGILCNTYLGSFWNESFAVFSDGLYHRNVPIGSIDERQRAFTFQGFPEASYRDRAIEGSGAFTGPVASALGYGKGAKVLAMLEQLIGTNQMMATMKEWVRTDAGKAVDWPDFERVAMRMNPDSHLKSFFDDWLRKPGYAQLSIEKVRFEEGKLYFSASFDGPSFRMPIEILVRGARGDTYQTFDLPGSGEYSISVGSKPNLAAFDPFLRALRKIDPSERIESVTRAVQDMPRFNDPAHADYLPGFGGKKVDSMPKSLNGVFLVGNPATLPAMREACRLAGFEISGDKLTYKGTTVDLRHGGAVALVDLPGGGQCAVGLGHADQSPNLGLSRVAVFDGYGHFLRGETRPRTSGAMTFRL